MGTRDQGKGVSISPPRKGGGDGESSADMHESIPRIRRRSPSVESDRRKRHRGDHRMQGSGGMDSGRKSRYDDNDLAVPRVQHSRSTPPARMQHTNHQQAPSSYGRPVNGASVNPTGMYGNGYSYGMHQPYNNVVYHRPMIPMQPTQQQLNKSRRLYVGNIPYHVGLSEMALTQFFSALYVAGFRPNEPGEPLPVCSVWLHSDGKFGFMELRGDQEAVNMMRLNGVFLHGRPLRINRPSDYRPEIHNPAAANLLPEPINIPAIVELCQQLGGVASAPAQLLAAAAANAVKERLEMEKRSSLEGSEAVVQSGNSTLPTEERRDEERRDEERRDGDVSPASKEDSLAQQRNTAPSVNLRSQPSPVKNVEGAASAPEPESGSRAEKAESGAENKSSVVVSLRNLVTNDDLDGNDEDYEDLVEDVREECRQYGTVLDVQVPRAGTWKGTAFIEYHSLADAEEAISVLRNRVFDGRRISAEIVEGCSSAVAALKKEASD